MVQQPAQQAYSAGQDVPPLAVVSAVALAASQQLCTGVGLIIAISACEQSGNSRMLYYLRDGTDATGQVIAVLGAPESQAPVAEVIPPGIPFRRGLYMQQLNGVISISITYIPLVNPVR